MTYLLILYYYYSIGTAMKRGAAKGTEVKASQPPTKKPRIARDVFDAFLGRPASLNVTYGAHSPGIVFGNMVVDFSGDLTMQESAKRINPIRFGNTVNITHGSHSPAVVVGNYVVESKKKKEKKMLPPPVTVEEVIDLEATAPPKMKKHNVPLVSDPD